MQNHDDIKIVHFFQAMDTNQKAKSIFSPSDSSEPTITKKYQNRVKFVNCILLKCFSIRDRLKNYSLEKIMKLLNNFWFLEKVKSYIQHHWNCIWYRNLFEDLCQSEYPMISLCHKSEDSSRNCGIKKNLHRFPIIKSDFVKSVISLKFYLIIKIHLNISFSISTRSSMKPI